MRSKLAVSLIALTALVGATSFAAAQNAPGASPTTTGPGTQDNMTRPGMATERGSMERGSMERGSMNSGAPGTTTGMGRGGVQPDASGQGGSGPGSDQGGTRVAPNNMK